MKETLKILPENLNPKTEITLENSGKNFVGYFTTPKNRKFKIEILFDEDIAQLNLKGYGLYFALWDENLKAWGSFLTNFQENTSLVFDAVTESLFKFLDEHHPDIVYFISNEESEPLYRKLVNEAALLFTEYNCNDFEGNRTGLFVLLGKTVPIEVIHQLETAYGKA